jgi:AcrR family transcriptional regulator
MGVVSSSSKEKVLEAAITLFQVKGFHGTSVRDIALKANVNVALVSYYFGGKQGLLEQLNVQFLEGYIQAMEQATEERLGQSSHEKLLAVMEQVLLYEQQASSLARLVLREMTLDSTLVREIMSTYMRKEKHLLETILRQGMGNQEFRKQPLDLLLLHIRTMMTMPFLQPHYLRELYQLSVNDPSFIKRYMVHVNDWMAACLLKKPIASSRLVIHLDS